MPVVWLLNFFLAVSHATPIPLFVATTALPILQNSHIRVLAMKDGQNWVRNRTDLSEFVGRETPVYIYYDGKVLGEARAKIEGRLGNLKLDISQTLQEKLKHYKTSYKWNIPNQGVPIYVYVTISNRPNLTDPDHWKRAQLASSLRVVAEKYMLSRNKVIHDCDRSIESKPKMVVRRTPPTTKDIMFSTRSFHSQKRNADLVGVRLKGDGDPMICRPKNDDSYDGSWEFSWKWLMIRNGKILAAIDEDIVPLDAADYLESGKSLWLVEGAQGDGASAYYIRDLELEHEDL